MKKNILFLLLVLTAVFSVTAEAVGTIIDYEGSSFGASIPPWVRDVAAGDAKRLQKHLGLAAESKVWILPVTGDSLDFISAWADSFDIVTLVISDVEQAVKTALEADPKLSASDKARIQEAAARELSLLTVSGLSKSTAFWIRSVPDAGDKTAFYTYYAVFTMRKDVWSRQIDAMLSNIENLSARAKKTAAAELRKISILQPPE